MSIQDRIQNLKKELQQLENQLGKTYPVGKIMRRKKSDGSYYDSLYTIIDWNGEIRFLNITSSVMWGNTIKSAPLRGSNKKVSFLSYEDFYKLLLPGNAKPENFEVIEISNHKSWSDLQKESRSRGVSGCFPFI